ncbi:MAG: class I SAM-dependent methyltransferase [Desulfitobacterium sp.]
MHHCNQPEQKFLTKIAFLDSRQREHLILPEALISQMPLQNNHTLLDIGAGTGFFTIPMAESTSSKVYALDPDARMLSVIEEKAKEKGLTNIELIQDYIENIRIQNKSVDFVMASLILHEVNSLTKVLSIIFEVLKTGGHLFCLEYEKDDLINEGPPMSIRIGSEDLAKTLSLIGFEIVKKSKINDAIYTVLAVKPVAAPISSS